MNNPSPIPQGTLSEDAPNTYQTTKLICYDIEVNPNYFLAGFIGPDGTVIQQDTAAGVLKTLRFIEQDGYELCGFNSDRYDDVVLTAFLKNGEPTEAYLASKSIIEDGVKPWTMDRNVWGVDLMPLLPGRMSLKQVGVRMYHKRLEELPVDPHANLTPEEIAVVKDYNVNDLVITQKLLKEIQPELDLRGDLSKEYNVDLRSKGDAGIAEVVISSEIFKQTNRSKQSLKEDARKNTQDVRVPVPSWMENIPNTPWANYVKESLRHRFDVQIPLDDNGRLIASTFEQTLYLYDGWYQLGVGGLHSIDGEGCHVAGEGFLIDVDVTSYYPAIMLTQKAFPRHIEGEFGEIFGNVVDKRLIAKKAKDKVTADRLKITINGTFGKTSDPYSSLYDPQCTATVTVTGQFALLILIGMLADAGLTTISSNTDGVTVKGTTDQKEVLVEVVTEWEKLTKFDMEYTEYSAVYQLDVNNYAAVLTNGGIKSKGCFVTPKPNKVDLRHAINYHICADAVKQYLSDGTAIEETVRSCIDINKFLITQAVKAGYKTSWKNQPLGKLLRFYKSTSPYAEAIIRTPGEGDKGNEGIVANSDSCIPVQDLPPTFPKDMDHQWYIDKANGWLKRLLQPKTTGNNALSYKLIQYGLTPALINTTATRASRKHFDLGTVDFNAMEEGYGVGFSTGKKAGVVAVVDTDSGLPVVVYKFTGNLPSKTRIKIEKDHSLRIVYGANLLYCEELNKVLTLRGGVQPLTQEIYDKWISEYYTPAELKKVGVILEEVG